MNTDHPRFGSGTDGLDKLREAAEALRLAASLLGEIEGTLPNRPGREIVESGIRRSKAQTEAIYSYLRALPRAMATPPSGFGA